MTSLFSFLITFLSILFWFLRAICTLMYQMSQEFFCEPLNVTLEIVILFATLPCLLLTIKRSIVGAAIYLGIYASYFGTALYEAVINMQETGVSIVNTSNIIVLIMGIIIPLLTFLDILFNKNRKGKSGDKNTDWFYNNKEYDREFDERSDRNQYRL